MWKKMKLFLFLYQIIWFFFPQLVLFEVDIYLSAFVLIYVSFLYWLWLTFTFIQTLIAKCYCLNGYLYLSSWFRLYRLLSTSNRNKVKKTRHCSDPHIQDWFWTEINNKLCIRYRRNHIKQSDLATDLENMIFLLELEQLYEVLQL